MTQTTHKPHLLLFNPDQWRGDFLGHMGCEAAVTPTLDAFAENEAVSFANAFCQNPVCTPSRCSFMTGWYPHVRGHRTMHHMLHPDEPVLLQRLKDDGYHVFWAGKNDIVPGNQPMDAYASEFSAPQVSVPDTHHLIHDAAEPYSFYLGQLPHDPTKGDYADGDWGQINEVIRRIETYPESEMAAKGQPLCLFVPINYPHPPYACEEPYYSMIEREKVTTPSPAGEGKASIISGIRKEQQLDHWSADQWTELRATYLAMCARVDEQFRRVLAALKSTGMYDDTATFFFSDHGDYTGDYGIVEKTQNTFEDAITRVPFLFKPPQGTPVQPGVNREALVELVDLTATVEDLAGLEPTHTHFGKSLLPVAAGSGNTHRDAVFCEGGRLPSETHTREAESLEGNPDTPYFPRMKMQIGDGPEHGKGVMCRTHTHKYVMRLTEDDEFYDLQKDPQEIHNQIHNPDYLEEIRQLRERTGRWLFETADVVPFQQDARW